MIEVLVVAIERLRELQKNAQVSGLHQKQIRLRPVFHNMVVEFQQQRGLDLVCAETGIVTDQPELGASIPPEGNGISSSTAASTHRDSVIGHKRQREESIQNPPSTREGDDDVKRSKTSSTTVPRGAPSLLEGSRGCPFCLRLWPHAGKFCSQNGIDHAELKRASGYSEC